MSRSRKRNPCTGNCAESDKTDKRHANKKFRAMERQALVCESDPPVNRREASNIYNFAKDGKHHMFAVSCRTAAWWCCKSDTDEYKKRIIRK